MFIYSRKCKVQLPPFTTWKQLEKLLFFTTELLGIILLVLMLSAASCNKASGGTYYVDSRNGSDSFDGRAPTHKNGNSGPWKTISRVNEENFLPGDSILFKRGGVWTDGPLEPRNGGIPGGIITIRDSIIGQPISFQLVDPQNHNCIYFGAYGDSPEKPLFNCRGGEGIVLLHNYIIVEDIHIENGGNNMLWLGRENGNSWIIIDSVDVTNCSGNAVRSSYGGGNIWLKALYVYNYGVNGILLNGSRNNKLRGVLVEDCWVENPEVLELEDAITCHRDSEENDLSGNIIIRNNTSIRAGEDGIDITTGSNILLEGNTLMYSHAGGIYVNYDWVNTVEVRGNFLYSNSISQGYGDLTIRSPRVRAVNNIIAGAGHHSVLIGNTTECQLWNNVIAPRGRSGNFIWLREGISGLEFKNNIFDFSGASQEIEGELTPNIVFDNNCYYGASPEQELFNNLTFQAMRTQNPLLEPHGIWANPQFLNPAKAEPGHFRTSRSSPCRDAGTPLSVSKDIWGTVRPQNGRIDLGAHEAITQKPQTQNDTRISGRAWHDPDGNCIRDAGEPGIARLMIELLDETGKFLAMEYSGTDGSYRFDGLPPGDYTLRAAPYNFYPGQPLEGMAAVCGQDGAFRRLALKAGAPATGQDLGFTARNAPAAELAGFTIEEGPNKARLHWSTSEERELSHFEVERSDDGREFFLKGHAKALGADGGQARNYYFTDEKPPAELTYYRLKIVRKDGSFSYSELRLANLANAKGTISISPSPFSNTLTLSLEQGATADMVRIIGLDGREVFKRNIKDARDLSLGLSALPRGSYYLVVRQDKESNVERAFPVVKE